MTGTSKLRPLQFAHVLLVSIALAMFVSAVGGCGRKNESTTTSTGATATPPSNAAAPPESTTGTAPPVATTTPATAGTASNTADLGTKVFQQRCVLCHGPEGRGDGIGGKALNPKPRNFHDKAYMSTRTDAQLSATIHNGKGAMPKWGGVLSEAEIQAVLKHVRELGKTP